MRVNQTCLFITNGLGLGNSTRSYAIMEHLAEQGFQIHVLTSGNGLSFFQDKTCIKSLTSMQSFYYSGKDGAVSGWKTFKSLSSLASIARGKRKELSALLDQVRPDVAIVDSEYALSPLRRRRLPIVALNTSEMVVTEYLKRRKVAPRSVRSHFWLVEFSDYLFHKRCCDLVLSPFPLRTPTRRPKFRRIGLIARRAVLEHAGRISDATFPSPRDIRTVVFMLSGSVHASNIRFGNDLPFRVEVVGVTGESRGNVTYHGRLMNNVPLLSRADALVINGGYSAVSEAFVLGKPVFVVPVSGHAEQFVNASVAQDLGLGFIAQENNVVDKLLGMYERNRWEGRKPLPAQFEIDGAREAASAISAFLKERTSSAAGAGESFPATRLQEPATEHKP
jgi:UDP:flavonoid glycosyltransferase YjiC (YdhE family)